MTEERKISAKSVRLITSEQQALEKAELDASFASQVREMYDSEQKDPYRWEKRVFFTASVFALPWLGITLFLIFTQIWYVFSSAVKFGSALTLWGISWISLFTFRKRSPFVTDLLCFLTSIFYGVVLWQAVPTFHIEIGNATIFWFWEVGVWLLALNSRSFLLPFLSSILFLFWGMFTSFFSIETVLPFPFLSVSLCGSTFPSFLLTIPVVSIVGWFLFRRRSAYVTQIYWNLFIFWIFPILFYLKPEISMWWIITIWSGVWLAVRYFIARKSLCSLELTILAFSLNILSTYKYHSYFLDCPPTMSIYATCLASSLLIILAVILIFVRGRGASQCYFTGTLLLLFWGGIKFKELFGHQNYICPSLVFFVLAFLFFLGALKWYHKRREREKPVPDDLPVEESPRIWCFFDPPRYAGWILLAAFLFQGASFCYQIIPTILGFCPAKEISVRTQSVDGAGESFQRKKERTISLLDRIPNRTTIFLNDLFIGEPVLKPDQNKPTLRGLHTWDFGNEKPVTPELLWHPLDVALDLFKREQMEGTFFHSTPSRYLGLEAVETPRQWIADHTEEQIGG